MTTLDLIAYGLTGSPWPLVLAYFLIATQLTIFSVTLYLHRSQAHRGVHFHPAIAHFFRFWCWLTTAMVTREWVAIHRKHHAHCETEGDPHSPHVHGIGKVAWHGVVLYQRASRDRALIERYGHGTPDDTLEQRLYARFPSLGPTVLALACLACFGMVGLALWAIQMLWIPVLAAGVVNGFGHWWGYRNYETADRSTNLSPIGVLIGGEELHNNHHAFPSSARFAHRRGEFDIGWLVIGLLARLKLARVVRVAPRLAEREGRAEADQLTIQALLSHRAEVLARYFRTVTLPTLAAELAAAREAAQGSARRLKRRLRAALANDGRWLDPSSRQRLTSFLSEHPRLAEVQEFRRRLEALLEQSSRRSEAFVDSVNAWCREAERSGHARLAAFAEQLRGLSVAA